MKAAVGPSGSSRLEEVNATFFHFIFVQVITLLWAFVYQGTLLTDLIAHFSHKFPTGKCLLTAARFFGSFVGYTLLVYSFLLILSAALAVYRLALIVDPNPD